MSCPVDALRREGIWVDDDDISNWLVEEARRRVVANGPHASFPRVFCWGKNCPADGTATILADGIIAEAIWLYNC